jgi:DNA-binding response OmpR family regulator
MGFEFRACYTGLQCLACIEEFQPQIVLLDLGIPEIGGFDLQRRICP